VDNDIDIFKEGVGGGGFTISSYQNFHLTELYETLLPHSSSNPSHSLSIPHPLQTPHPFQTPHPSQICTNPPPFVSSFPIPPYLTAL